MICIFITVNIEITIEIYIYLIPIVEQRFSINGIK